jgi:hypothetical protein
MQIRPFNRSLLARSILGASLALVGGASALADYQSTVLGDAPKAYYRFNDSSTRGNINVNSGTLGAAGNATNLNVHAFPGGIAGDGNRSQFFDSTARSIIPWNAAINPTNTQPFTFEGWFYPANDQINGGQAVVNNRYSYSGVNRQGWVIFQRAQDTSYSSAGGYEGVGWNFRMYRGSGSSSGLDVVSQVPFQIGQWTHVAVVYDPVDPITNASLTIYINGVAANTNLWTGGGTGTDPGYVANTDDHPPAEAVNGAAGLALGSYNNTQPGSNPYFGAVDEVAFYAAKLTPEQILAHYQNGTNASRSMAYDALIKSQNPAAYLRLDELTPGPDVAINMGNLEAAGVASTAATVKHPGQSALAGRTDDGSHSGHWRDVGGSFTDIPWNAANNPDAGTPFTLEAWFKPTADRTAPGPSPINNRLANGIPNRTGWVIYQRDPNDTYSPSSGESAIGWTLRTYQGTGGNSSDIVSGGPYTIGEWQHVVFTWDPTSTGNGSDLGTTASGSELWSGTLIVYTNGVAAATNDAASYAANLQVPGDVPTRAPADMAIGSYNLASGGGEEFEVDIDEVAFYNNYLLTPDQILAHYQAGTNAHPATNYETLVLNAAYDGLGTQRSMPATYLRFNEPPANPAANSGTLGSAADGSLVLTANNVPGPITAGFGSANLAIPLDGLKSFASLNDPAGLNISGQVTLEAWINPAATQGDPARIISHGPPTPTFYDPNTHAFTLSGSQLSSNEVFLRIEGSGANYSVGTSDGFTTHGATAAVTAGDLGGGNGWIHLAGTYDGTHWNLYRNGVQIATVADAVGALPVSGAEWSIGATGMGWADLYSGSVDEAAIYNKALSASQVAAHYAAATTRPSVTITHNGSTVTLTWPGTATLQRCDTVNGTYLDVPGATSGYTATPGFYRLKL